MSATNPRNRPERRKKKRIQLTRAMIARLGALGVVVIDVTDAGARIEHFQRLDVGKRSRFLLEWRDKSIEAEAVVVSCKIHRFAHGDQGATVYQSGLFFSGYTEDAAAVLRDMCASFVARSLAEQVANARGIGPVTERNMPVFRGGSMASSGIDPSHEKSKRLLSDNAIMVDRGYVRCTLINDRRWDKKWSRVSDQPDAGFTVLATEPNEHIEQLCELYLRGSAEDRQLIQLLARVSVEKSQETPEPREMIT